MNDNKTLHSKVISLVESNEYLYNILILDYLCDTDPRQPYYDVKKHANGKSYYLSLRTQRWPAGTKSNPYSGRPARANKKFFGKNRQECAVKAARYVLEGKF